ncbi:MAG: signal peptidase II [Cyanobacteria bacterium P01_H01_bin.74]
MQKSNLTEHKRSKSQLWFYRAQMVCIAGLAAVIDQYSKHLALTHLIPGNSLPLIPDVIQLSLAFNSGAAFSLLANRPEFLLWISTGLFLILLSLSLWQANSSFILRLGFGLILGGGAGNLLDRMYTGAVTDFIDVILIHYPIFNGGDVFIFMGSCCVFIHFLGQLKTKQSF